MEENYQVTYLNPETMPKSNGYSHAVEVRHARMIYISGQIALNPEGQLVGAGDLALQTRQVFDNIKSALEAAETGFGDVVKLTFYLTDISQMQIVRDIRDQYINAANPPASSAVEVRKLIRDEFLIEVEATAAAQL
jgi:reactive intermediate/imine deaminase